MSLTPEEQLRLSACIQEIAQILYKNTDSAEIATLEGLEKVVRQQMRLICQSQSCPFFIQKVTKTVKGRSRTLNSCVGRLFITQKQANRLGIEPYSRRSSLLEKCCFLLSASESYQNASVDLATLTGVYVSHSSQHRQVQRQEFAVPEAKLAIAQVSIDGGKVRLRTERGLPCEWRDYKAVRLQDLYYGAFFQDNFSRS